MSTAIYVLIAIGHLVGYYLVFPAAGRKSWEALVPGYNFYVLTRIIKKPWWWALLLIFPGVNVLMLMVFNSVLATVLNKRSANEQLMAIFIPFVAFPLWGRQGVSYVGPIDRAVHKKSTIREWGDSIVFAVVAASIIRTYFLEAFTIPTGSMEKSLLVGDFLFVSKMAYGPKIPQTPLSFPFAHHTLPGTNIKSYLEWMTLPFHRLPGFGEVERNDIVVFNYPEGDTVCVELQSNRSYNQVLRDYTALFGEEYARDFIWNGVPVKYQRSAQVSDLQMILGSMGLDANVVAKIVSAGFDITVRPVDKREHYIKRCVAVPGDSIFIENARLHLNGERAYIPFDFQYNYKVEASGLLNQNILKDKLELSLRDMHSVECDPTAAPDAICYEFPLTLKMASDLRRYTSVERVYPHLHQPQQRFSFPIFPNRADHQWTEDFWGPLTVPKAGTTVQISLDNLPYYERIIRIYEGHKLRVRDGQIIIDGQPATEYTFAYNYYFMMGDNRHNSADSRFWGFVPEDHVVGRAAFIWLSLDDELPLFGGKIRWSRLFTIPE